MDAVFASHSEHSVSKVATAVATLSGFLSAGNPLVGASFGGKPTLNRYF